MALPPLTLVPLRWKGVMLDGSPASGQIVLRPRAERFLVDDLSIFAVLLTATIADDGTANLLVPATDDPALTTDGFTYEVTEDLRGDSGAVFDIEVPLSAATDGIDLNAVAHVAPAPGVPVSLVTRAEFDALSDALAAAPTTEDLTAVTGQIETVSGALDTVSGTVSNVSETVDTLSDTLETVSGDLTTVSSTVDGLSTHAGAVDGAIGSLSTALGNQTTALTNEVAARAGADSLRALDPFRFDASRLRAFRGALGKRSTTPVDVLAVGASWLAGSGAGTPPTGRWFDLARDALRTFYQPAGVAGGLGYRESYSFTSGWVSPFTYTTTTGANGTTTTFGLGRKTVTLKAGNAVSAVVPTGGSGLIVLYGKGPTGGNFTWKVNAGTATTVSAASASAATVALTIPAVPGDTITLSATTAALYFMGAYFLGGDETKGTRFWNGATSGYRTSDFVDGLGLSYDAWTIVDPDLVVIGDLVANDYGGGTALSPVPVATTKTNLATIVAAIRARSTRPPSIILMIPPEILAASTPLATWATYRQAMLDFAQADGNVTVWDVAPLFGSMVGADSYGITAGDQAHPNASGHQMLADSFVSLIRSA